MSGEWMLQAACRLADPELPFAGEGTEEEARFIRKYCEECPVRKQCLQFALDHDDVGVYGGLNRKHRRLVQAEVAGRKDIVPCGTDRAYFRHRRRGETPCEDCKRAHTDTTNGYYRGKRATAKAPPEDTGRCGTHAGYQAHLGRGQESCGPCSEAASTHRTQRAAARAGSVQ